MSSYLLEDNELQNIYLQEDHVEDITGKFHNNSNFSISIFYSMFFTLALKKIVIFFWLEREIYIVTKDRNEPTFNEIAEEISLGMYYNLRYVYVWQGLKR